MDLLMTPNVWSECPSSWLESVLALIVLEAEDKDMSETRQTFIKSFKSSRDIEVTILVVCWSSRASALHVWLFQCSNTLIQVSSPSCSAEVHRPVITSGVLKQRNESNMQVLAFEDQDTIRPTSLQQT